MRTISKTKIKKFLLAGIVAVLFSTPFLVDFAMVKEADGISLACSKSAECRAAADREAQANQNAANASNTANMFQLKVMELNSQIAAMQRQIADTVAQVDDLKDQIKKTEKKLAEEQDALAELLINMHFEGDAEPITILAGSSSISDLSERMARNEVVKEQITATAENIKEQKAKLEEDKAKVEQLLEQQKESKAQLESARAEQQALVVKYENDAAAYEAQAKAALAEKRAAEEKYQREHPEIFAQGLVYGGANTYPWQANCPGDMDAYYTMYGGRYIGGYVCECTSYAGWKAYEATGGTLAISWWGNAKSWAQSARNAGFRVDHNPSAGSIGQSGNPGDYGTGHVFWVESVNADGSVNITEYNNWWSTGKLTGSYHVGDFGAQTLSASEARKYNYIHVI